MSTSHNHRVSPLSPCVLGALEASGCGILGQVDLPPRPVSYSAAPKSLHPKLFSALSARYPEGLFAHQSMALLALSRGENVCIATPTASGKSLVFMAAAIDVALRDPNARVLVLYPARALIQDQSNKWNELLSRVGLTHAIIDGSVQGKQHRNDLIRNHRIILMTPDVVQAWLLARLGEPEVRAFVDRLALLVLDEAHAYEGVFGTNMAYMLRRLRVASRAFRLIASTATIDDPKGFLKRLSGLDVTVIDANDDGAPAPARSIVHLSAASASVQDKSRLIGALSQGSERFLAFADSRKTVELVVAGLTQENLCVDEEDPAENDTDPIANSKVLPYRAGFESADRIAIQNALSRGRLAGVVSTSAMELGIDIGEINLVVMLGVPPTMKSFRQRLGRAGRRSDSVCLLVDHGETLGEDPDAIERYLARPAEASWLYLENRYIQYANALCAAAEARVHGRGAEAEAYADLPESFRALLDNELDTRSAIADDLYPLKQRAENGPHWEFPIRHGSERSFKVKGNHEQDIGFLSFSQVLREAYPGAIYYYMARPYRVRRFDFREGIINVSPLKYGITKPVQQSMVFPKFEGAMHLRRGDLGFVTETPLQVSQRVLGFTEGKLKHTYAPGAKYYQRDLCHFITTTGVCWYFPPKSVVSAATGAYILTAFCGLFGIHEGDVGLGSFHATGSPIGPGVCQGMCLFDTNHGSLRLTQRLMERFDDVLERAVEVASYEDKQEVVESLELLSRYFTETRVIPRASGDGSEPVMGDENEWLEVIVAGERAMLMSDEGAREVTVLGFRYTPRGLMYDLAPLRPGVSWQMPSRSVQPIHGVTRTERRNLVTGEVA